MTLQPGEGERQLQGARRAADYAGPPAERDPSTCGGVHARTVA